MSQDKQRTKPGHDDSNRTPASATDWSAYKLDPMPENLFDTLAENAASIINSTTGKNNPSQLRGFYDEVITWDQRSRQWTDEQFKRHLPLIKMLNAKVAYAKGRGLVDENYFSLIRHLLSQVKEKEHLHKFKLFLEAFHGFYKAVRPK